MAKERKDGFPLVGDKVLATDGSVWLFEQPDGQDPQWTQQAPHLSADELEELDAAEAELLKRLSLAHRVFAVAFGGQRVMKRDDALNESDPPDAFVLALAQNALRDAVVAVCSDDHRPSDLEARAGTRFRAFLGDPEWGTIQSKLNEIRTRLADEDNPEGVAAKAREPLNELAELSGKLPTDSDARKTITAIASSRKAQPELADKLFRELVVMGVDVETAKRAQGAASSIAAAYG